MRGFISFLLDMLLPPLCVHCGTEIPVRPSAHGAAVPAGLSPALLSFLALGPVTMCRDCWLRLEPAHNPSPLSPKPAAGAPSGTPSDVSAGDRSLRAVGTVRGDPVPNRAHTSPVPLVITSFFTNEVLLSLVRFLKFEGGAPAADPLSWWMAQTLDLRGDLSGAEPLLIPVPLHRRRKRERGYNQAALLALGIAERLGLPFDDRLLTRSRHTRSQARLADGERDRNVRSAFHLEEAHPIRGRHVILVDDLVTSGATARSCIEAIRPAGPSRVTVLAAGRRKSI